MDIKIGHLYRLKSNKQYTVKVESLSGRKVIYSRPGSIISKGRSKADFLIKFEECP
jgi:hypothetical protein